MSCQVILLGADQQFLIREVQNPETLEYVSDAAVAVTLYEDDGETEIAGQVWPQAMAYVVGSNGNYACTISKDIVAEDGDLGVAIVTIQSGTFDSTLRFDLQYESYDETQLDWTSRQELEDMFGPANVSKWADIDSDESETTINRRVRWAIREATEDAKLMLAGGPVSVSRLTCAPRPLRMATTRLAGVLLYEGRGVTDTADPEGRNRLASHQKKAKLFFQQVASGQLRLASHATTFPKVVSCPSSSDLEVKEVGTDLWT